MKRSFLIATAVCIACSASSLSAQIAVLDDASDSAAAEINAVENPFDFLTEPSQSPSDLSGQPGNQPAPADTPDDPNSLPAESEAANLVDTIVTHDILQGVPDASMTPMIWGQAGRAPNQVARAMLHEECNVRALWAGYPAERAAECAHMWNKLSGQHGCLGGGCRTGCPTACTTGCDTPCPPVRNRYREQAIPNCDACAQHVAAPAPQTNTELPPLPNSILPASAPVNSPLPAPSPAPQPGGEDKVAFVSNAIIR